LATGVRILGFAGLVHSRPPSRRIISEQKRLLDNPTCATNTAILIDAMETLASQRLPRLASAHPAGLIRDITRDARRINGGGGQTLQRNIE